MAAEIVVVVVVNVDVMGWVVALDGRLPTP